MVERITFTSAPARFNGGGGTISLRLGLKGYAAEGGHSSRATAEMGQIDRRRRRRGCARRLPPRTLAPANRLDKTLSIDGPVGLGANAGPPRPLPAKVSNWRSAKKGRRSSIFSSRHPPPPANTIGVRGSNSREILTFWRFGGAIWREGGRWPKRRGAGVGYLPLCQCRDTVGKVVFELNIINHKGL